MERLVFDESELTARLIALNDWRVSVFTASCAQRLLPLHRRFRTEGAPAEGPDAVEDALDRLWRDLAKTSLGPQELKRLIAVCEHLVPSDEDVNASIWQSFSQYSVSAVAYALRYRLTSAVQEAVWCARQAHEAIYFHVVNRDHVDINGPSALERIDAKPEMQAELRRQDVDIALLATGRDGVAKLNRIRSRSENSPAIVIRSPSAD